MTTSVETTNAGRARGEAIVDSIVTWVRGHRQASMYIAAGVLAAALVGGWSLLSQRETEARASQALSEARFALESENLPLAASEFARVAENYAGTRAAEEATVLLARVRLQQGQAQQAVDVLRGYAPKADDDYRAQALGLLGAAYENLGNAREAAGAYAEAARVAPWAFLAAQFLSDAGRALTAAGDTLGAIQSYQRIVDEYAETGPVVEAKVRIGELTARSLRGSVR
jgi:tetratricopeptide (TPR) repeat protein